MIWKMSLIFFFYDPPPMFELIQNSTCQILTVSELLALPQGWL